MHSGEPACVRSPLHVYAKKGGFDGFDVVNSLGKQISEVGLVRVLVGIIPAI